MKILLVANMYPNDKYPNYGVFVKNTKEILEQEGHHIDKVVLHKQTNKYVKLFLYLLYFGKILFKGLFKHYDVIYVHYASHNSLPLLSLKKLKRSVKIFTNVHGSDIVPQVASQEKYQPYVKRLLEVSNKVIAPSRYFKKLIREKYHIDTPIEVFPSGGINKNVFYKMDSKKEILQELHLNTEYRYVGFVGRLDVGKGWETFLEAIHQLEHEGELNHIKAIVVGGGKDEGRFNETLNQLGLADVITHFPLLPHNQLAKVYNSLDVFCFPTKGESLGLVGLEAMACGVPVIGSRVGGLLDYLEDGKNGILFEPGNAVELASAIQSFFRQSEQDREVMSQAALNKASEYEIEKIKPELIRIFKSLY